jgi:hypothetical protein
MSRQRSSTKQELPDLTFFVDADLSDHIFHGILAAANVRFEPHDAHFNKGTDDEDWLTKAGPLGWIVLTHNKKIRWNSAQTERLMEAGVGAFMFIGKPGKNPPGQTSVFTRELAENFVRLLPDIGQFVKRHARPWTAKLYRPGGGIVSGPAGAPSSASDRARVELRDAAALARCCSAGANQIAVGGNVTDPEIIAELEKLRRQHYVCDGDCWYSCPAAESEWKVNGGSACCDDELVARTNRACNCGADADNAILDRVLAALRQREAA